MIHSIGTTVYVTDLKDYGIVKSEPKSFGGHHRYDVEMRRRKNNDGSHLFHIHPAKMEKMSMTIDEGLFDL